VLPPALWSGQSVECIFGAGVDFCGPIPLPRRSDSGKSRLGPASRDRRLEEKHRLFVQFAFLAFTE
jgi:hypothetical protein